MQIFEWPARIQRDEDAHLVTFADFPAALTDGATKEEALINAEDALVTVLAELVDQGQPLPPQRPAKRSETMIGLSPVNAGKIALRLAMKDQGLTQKALAHRVGKTQQHVQRCLKLDTNARIEQLQQLIEAAGWHLVTAVRAPDDKAA